MIPLQSSQVFTHTRPHNHHFTALQPIHTLYYSTASLIMSSPTGPHPHNTGFLQVFNLCAKVIQVDKFSAKELDRAANKACVGLYKANSKVQAEPLFSVKNTFTDMVCPEGSRPTSHWDYSDLVRGEGEEHPMITICGWLWDINIQEGDLIMISGYWAPSLHSIQWETTKQFVSFVRIEEDDLRV